MSGIIGICYLDEHPIVPPKLERMTKSLEHRGPDGSGVWNDRSVGFGHRMLWTTPESLNEKLPLVGEASGCVITADARIDNRDALCGSLGFSSANEISDSGLILAAYEAWGECCPEKLVGDFAFAIWDKRKRKLFAARDRIGVKPFYYHHQEGRIFAFASEISPLFPAVGLEKRPDRDSMEHFLATSSVPHERTFFEEIWRLPPASTLVIKNGRITARKYWEPASGRVTRPPNLDEHAEEFLHLFSEAVKAQTRSAFPIGCLLSGGLDSSSILCLASRLIPDKKALPAFSLVFDRLPCDERTFIQDTIQLTGVEWFSTVADADEVDGRELLQTYYDECPEWPVRGFCPSTFWPLLDMARNRGVRVMLTGHGGDHLTQGSFYYLADLLHSFRLVSLAKELSCYQFSSWVIFQYLLKPLCPDRMKIWLKRLIHPLQKRKDGRLSPKTGSRAQGRKSRPPPSRFATRAAWDESGLITGSSLSLWLDSYWEPLAGRSNIEFRHPFFDIRLMDFLLSLPSEEKIWHGQAKIILRQGMKNILPEKVRAREDKTEFSPVIAFALKNFAIDPETYTLARSGLVEDSELRKLLANYNNNPTLGESSPVSERLLCVNIWQTLCLEAWYSNNVHVSIGDGYD